MRNKNLLGYKKLPLRRKYMWGIFAILLFTALLAFPGIYIITRKIFPKKSKKMAAWVSGITTIVFLFLLTVSMLGTTW